MKHFVFDLGGVIAKPMDRKNIYDNLNLTIDYEQFKYIFSDGEEATKVHKGQMSIEKYFEFLKQYLKKETSFQEFIKIYQKSKKGLYEDTVEIINKLKSSGFKIYLLSNLREIDFEIFQKGFDTSIFTEMFLSYDIDMLKPNDDIYQYMLNKINDLPSNIYFFDDNENNINGALRNGINAYKVTGDNIKEVITKLKI